MQASMSQRRSAYATRRSRTSVGSSTRAWEGASDTKSSAWFSELGGLMTGGCDATPGRVCSVAVTEDAVGAEGCAGSCAREQPARQMLDSWGPATELRELFTDNAAGVEVVIKCLRCSQSAIQGALGVCGSSTKLSGSSQPTIKNPSSVPSSTVCRPIEWSGPTRA